MTYGSPRPQNVKIVDGSGSIDTSDLAKEETLAELLSINENPTTINTDIPNPFDVSSTPRVIPLNTARKGLIIYNPLAFDIFIGLQATVSSTSYAVKMAPDSYWETPYGYIGIVSVVSAGSNTGNAQVREII